MNAQQILDKGVNYTFNDYYVTNENLEAKARAKQSEIHSSLMLAKVIKSKSKAFSTYSMSPELKEEIKTLSNNEIRKELLKNMANNAVIIKNNMNDKLKANDTKIRPGMDADDISVIVYNNMLKHGVQRGYYMLTNYSILLDACELYVRNRINNRASYFDEIALSNDEGIAMNNAIDEYFDCKTKVKNEKVKTLIKK